MLNILVPSYAICDAALCSMQDSKDKRKTEKEKRIRKRKAWRAISITKLICASCGSARLQKKDPKTKRPRTVELAHARLNQLRYLI